jgi:hypothetical protein
VTSSVNEGDFVTLSGNFADPGALDAHTARIDWGDGTTTVAALTESGGPGTVAGNHAYASGGIYTSSVTLTDDDGGTATAVTSAVVAGAGIHDGALQIIGTDANDCVKVSKLWCCQLLVYASMLPDCGLRAFDPAGVDRIVVLLGGGNDYASVSNCIRIAAILDGGSGDDVLVGLNWNEVVVEL